MKRKLTDFELATIGSVGAVVADLFWLANDVIHSGRWDHLGTAIGLTASAAFCIWGWIRHRKTGNKPVQSKDDIYYAIDLYMRRDKFKKHCAKERLIRKGH